MSIAGDGPMTTLQWLGYAQMLSSPLTNKTRQLGLDRGGPVLLKLPGGSARLKLVTLSKPPIQHLFAQ